MEKEIIIPRKKSKAIGYAILMLLVTVMFVFLAVTKLANIPWINADGVPLLLAILSLICAPICAYCFIHYLREIFNNNPALIINQSGIHEQISKYDVGMIKWDDIEKDNNTTESYKKDIYNKVPYLGYAPIIFISAKTGQRVNKLFELINQVAANNAMRVGTSVINQVLNEAIALVQPPTDKGKRLKIFYMTQASTKPPTFVIFVNDKELFHFSYERYLINQLRKEFGLQGTPIRMIVREKSDKE